jgi:hypothetical protein
MATAVSVFPSISAPTGVGARAIAVAGAALAPDAVWPLAQAAYRSAERRQGQS